jgi:hypothetical protein
VTGPADELATAIEQAGADGCYLIVLERALAVTILEELLERQLAAEAHTALPALSGDNAGTLRVACCDSKGTLAGRRAKSEGVEMSAPGPPTTRVTLHRLRGATAAYLECLRDARALLADDPTVDDVHEQLVSALERVPTDGAPGAIRDVVEDAIARIQA